MIFLSLSFFFFYYDFLLSLFFFFLDWNKQTLKRTKDNNQETWKIILENSRIKKQDDTFFFKWQKAKIKTQKNNQEFQDGYSWKKARNKMDFEIDKENKRGRQTWD